MENFMLSANAVLPMFLLLAAGYLSKRFGILSLEDIPRTNRIAFRIFLPCLLFYNIYNAELSYAIRPKLILFAVCGVLLVFAGAVYGAHRFERNQDRKGPIAQGIFRSNFVIMGIPIAQAIVGDADLSPVAILIAVIVPMFNFLSVVILEKFRGGRVKTGEVLLEIAKNPLIIGSVLGIVFLLLHIRLPAVVEKAVSNLGSIATPLQLFLLGAFFRFSGLRHYVRPLTVVTLVKLFVTPAVMLSAAALLGIRGVEFLGLIGIFASPTAINSFTMVQQMKCGDAELAGDIVVMTSAVSIFSFFIWIYLFKSLGMF
ncbi:MAG: AEC family transporter [Oscillospiraceae bacterium]|nr:AEC family transporter [Oscillospiraceae bacterium]MBR2808186.1 AEC family transporter [Oscillospiraceae bacterium]